MKNLNKIWYLSTISQLENKIEWSCSTHERTQLKGGWSSHTLEQRRSLWPAVNRDSSMEVPLWGTDLIGRVCGVGGSILVGASIVSSSVEPCSSRGGVTSQDFFFKFGNKICWYWLKIHKELKLLSLFKSFITKLFQTSNYSLMNSFEENRFPKYYFEISQTYASLFCKGNIL
jgi:hypothetical protein